MSSPDSPSFEFRDQSQAFNDAVEALREIQTIIDSIGLAQLSQDAEIVDFLKNPGDLVEEGGSTKYSFVEHEDMETKKIIGASLMFELDAVRNGSQYEPKTNFCFTIEPADDSDPETLISVEFKGLENKWFINFENKTRDVALPKVKTFIDEFGISTRVQETRKERALELIKNFCGCMKDVIEVDNDSQN